MRIISIVILSVFILLLSPLTARAESPGDPGMVSQGQPRVVLLEDQENAAFRFMIDDREVARLDAEGFHVRENIELGGTLTDAGTAYFDKRFAEGDKP